MSPIPVIIDTDVALDDYMAILYLLMNPNVQVIGITTTGVGAAHLKAGTTNVLKLLELAGQPNIPVAMGTSAPLQYSNVFPGAWRSLVDNLYDIPLPTPSATPVSQSAEGWLTSTILNPDLPAASILSIGGGTNFGTVLPKIMSQVTPGQTIGTFVMMGGALNVPGNVNAFNPDYNNTVAEWNIFIDPQGAQNVLQSGLPITLVPLDASNQVPLDTNFYQALMAAIVDAQGSQIARQVSTFIFAGLSTQLGTIVQSGVNGYYFWDPLAALVLADTSGSIVQKTQPTPLQVQTQLVEGDDTSGSLVQGNGGATINVALTVDAALAQQSFLSTIAGISQDQAAAYLGRG